MRRGSLVQLILLGLVAAAITTAVAWFVPWLPEAGGEEADRIHFVYWFATVIAIAVFSVVAAVLTYSVLKFRVRPDDDSDGPPVHGHTGLEIVWTAIPTVLVTSISIVSAIVLAQNSHAGDNPLKIRVVAQQFAWQFTYPNGQTYGHMTVPVNRTVELDITAKDVLHSFWVPQLSQKQDAVVGQHNKLLITPTKVNTYPIICTELCGLGHSLMRSRIEVMTKANYDKWYQTGGRKAGQDPGLAVFNQFGCGGCHTFKAANAGGKVGPDLDKLKEEAATAKKPVEDFIRESIEDPNAYVQPGYSPGVMPPFKGQIQPKDLDALVKFLAENAQ